MSENLDQLAAFLRHLAQALHISGMPAHDLESHLNRLGQRLGVRVDCFAVLTMLTLNITADNATQRVEMLRLPSVRRVLSAHDRRVLHRAQPDCKYHQDGR